MDNRLASTQAFFLGLFVVISLGLTTLGLFSVATKDGWSSETVTVRTAMPKVSGLREGAQVRVLGIPVGQVTAVRAPQSPQQPVVVEFEIAKSHQQLVREDAVVRIFKDGIVGERLLEIDPGSTEASPIQEGSSLNSEISPEWEEIASRIDKVVADVAEGKGTVGKLLTDPSAHESLLRLAKEGESVFGQARQIISGIQQGKGTAGRLVKGQDAYESFESLVARADTVLESVDESHQALKQTWPVRSMVTDRYDLLVRPETQMHRKVFSSNELFEPEKAILTEEGKKKLDEVADWLHGFDEWESDVVIAGFATETEDSRLADIITRKQSEAVRSYLVDEKSAHRRGWVSRRDISSHGFGNKRHPLPEVKLPAQSILLTAFLK